MSNRKNVFMRHQGMSPMYKSGTHKITSCPHAFYANLIDKIQQIQICTITKNLTPTIQSYQNINFEILVGPSLASQIRWFLSFQVLHHMVNGIIFQIPKSQPLFVFLIQVINALLIVRGCTQLTSSKENDKCQNPETPTMNKKVVNQFFLLKTHIGHLLGNLKFLCLSISSVGTFPLVAA